MIDEASDEETLPIGELKKKTLLVYQRLKKKGGGTSSETPTVISYFAMELIQYPTEIDVAIGTPDVEPKAKKKWIILLLLRPETIKENHKGTCF